LNPKTIQLLQISPKIMEVVYEETYSYMGVLVDIFYYDIAAKETKVPLRGDCQ